MPKKITYDKKTGARNRRSSSTPTGQKMSSRAHNVSSINQLLSTRSILRKLVDKIPVQQSWTDWLRATLAADFAAHIVNVLPKNDELVVFADSAAWSARLRYALVAISAAISARDGAIRRTRVRVQRPLAP